jgi:hypothetical protein
MARWMYDASTPPSDPPKWHVAGGYIGGNTPHVWTPEEWDDQPASCRLPIFTGAGSVNDGGEGSKAASDALHALRDLAVPTGSLVALDMETDVLVDYVLEFDYSLRLSGYHCVVYGSADSIRDYPTEVPYLWVADWSDSLMEAVDEIGQRIIAVQLRSADQLGKPYDFSVIEDSAPLWTVVPKR